jgi:para-nitrobenzyl esterase
MPETEGLFHAAINQSGPLGLTIPRDRALSFSAGLAAHLGVSADRSGFATLSPGALLDGVESFAGDINDLVNKPASGPRIRLGLGPVEDPQRVPWHRTGDLLDSFSNRVPFLAGFTAEELLLMEWPRPASLTRQQATEAINALGVDAGKVMAQLCERDPDLSFDAMVRKAREQATIISDILRLLEAGRELGVPVWGYELGWRTNAFDGRPGAYHVLDIPFVFDTLATEHALEMTGEGAPQELADAMHGEWVEFITHHGLARPQFHGIDSIRWFDTETRDERRNTTSVAEMFLIGG